MKCQLSTITCTDLEGFNTTELKLLLKDVLASYMLSNVIYKFKKESAADEKEGTTYLPAVDLYPSTSTAFMVNTQEIPDAALHCHKYLKLWIMGKTLSFILT